MHTTKLTPMGRRIHAGMIAVGIRTESELARKIGVSHQTVRRLLYEHVRADGLTIMRLSDTLRLSGRWLLLGEGLPGIRASLTPNAMRLVEIYDRLDPKARRILLAAATDLVSL